MPSALQIKQWRADLKFAEEQVEFLKRQYRVSATTTGGQISDKSRVEVPPIKHIAKELHDWLAEVARLSALLDPATSARGYVPRGYLK